MTPSLSGLVSRGPVETLASLCNCSFAGNLEAAGPGFEPGLSDSELVLIHSLAFL